MKSRKRSGIRWKSFIFPAYQIATKTIVAINFLLSNRGQQKRHRSHLNELKKVLFGFNICSWCFSLFGANKPVGSKCRKVRKIDIAVTVAVTKQLSLNRPGRRTIEQVISSAVSVASIDRIRCI